MIMLKVSTKQGEAGFERISARFPKQSVQSWMPERLNIKPLGRERTRQTQELRQAGHWTKAQCSNRIWWYKGTEDKHIWRQQLRGVWGNKENKKGFAFPGSISWSHRAPMWFTTRLLKAESQNISSNFLLNNSWEQTTKYSKVSN